MMHADNHATCGQEQQGFEKGVRHHVEYGNAVGRCAQRHRHIAQLRQSGIRHHALDVVLDHAQKAHKQGRNRTGNHHHIQRCARHFIQRRHARHHKDTGRYHGGGVNQGRNRCRAFHRIRQPHMQGELCRFAHCTHKQQDAGNGEQRPLLPRNQLKRGIGQRRCIAEHIAVVQAAAKIA